MQMIEGGKIAVGIRRSIIHIRCGIYIRMYVHVHVHVYTYHSNSYHGHEGNIYAHACVIAEGAQYLSYIFVFIFHIFCLCV